MIVDQTAAAHDRPCNRLHRCILHRHSEVHSHQHVPSLDRAVGETVMLMTATTVHPRMFDSGNGSGTMGRGRPVPLTPRWSHSPCLRVDSGAPAMPQQCAAVLSPRSSSMTGRAGLLEQTKRVSTEAMPRKRGGQHLLMTALAVPAQVTGGGSLTETNIVEQDPVFRARPAGGESSAILLTPPLHPY